MIDDTYLEEFNLHTDRYRHCVKKILNLKNKQNFYIGITNDPNDRINEHIYEKNMSTMYLLTKTYTKLKCIKLEQALIKRFKQPKNINQDGEDGGVKYKENYIYILFE